jgi:hypothetical protein
VVELEIKVTGMMCDGCTSRVQEALQVRGARACMPWLHNQLHMPCGLLHSCSNIF